MLVIKIEQFDNCSHANQTISGANPATFPIPDGWAWFPDDLPRENFPFGTVTVENLPYTPPGTTNETGEETGEESGEEDALIIPTVTSWTPGVMPEPTPEPEPEDTATQLDMVEAQATYTAMVTGTLLEV